MHSLWNTYALNPWFADHVWWWSWKWLLGWHCNWWHFDKKWNMCFSNHLSDYANDRIHSVLSYVFFSLHRYTYRLLLNGQIFSKLLPSYNDDCMIHMYTFKYLDLIWTHCKNDNYAKVFNTYSHALGCSSNDHFSVSWSVIVLKIIYMYVCICTIRCLFNE